MKMVSQDRFEKARKTFRSRGGVLRMSEALQAGIHRRMLYSMLEAGLIEQLNRGLYRLTDLPPLGNPDLVSVSLRIPNGVICLISALAYHEITTQVPHEVYVALERGTEPPRLGHPPVRIFWFSGQAFIDYRLKSTSSRKLCQPMISGVMISGGKWQLIWTLSDRASSNYHTFNNHCDVNFSSTLSLNLP
jgi:hypothetical protein